MYRDLYFSFVSLFFSDFDDYKESILEFRIVVNVDNIKVNFYENQKFLKIEPLLLINIYKPTINALLTTNSNSFIVNITKIDCTVNEQNDNDIITHYRY